MSKSYEEYEQEYNAALSRVRSYLAGTRTRTTLVECDRLLKQAHDVATAMQSIQNIPSDLQYEARQRLERDLKPLTNEVQRQLAQSDREELFYQPPNHQSSDLESLIASSEDLLRESHSVLADTEMIGTSTLQQMGRQREQLLNANSNLDAVQNVSVRAKNILVGMSRRALKNKLCLYFLIALLSVANLYVLVLIFKKHHHHDKSNN